MPDTPSPDSTAPTHHDQSEGFIPDVCPRCCADRIERGVAHPQQPSALRLSLSFLGGYEKLIEPVADELSRLRSELAEVRSANLSLLNAATLNAAQLSEARESLSALQRELTLELAPMDGETLQQAARRVVVNAATYVLTHRTSDEQVARLEAENAELKANPPRCESVCFAVKLTEERGRRIEALLASLRVND